MEKQDPVEVAPDIYQVALENDRVRVLSINQKPGQTSPEHWHPAFVLYIVNGGRVKFSYPDGESEELDVQAGQAIWGDEVADAVENTGNTEVHAVCVEV